MNKAVKVNEENMDDLISISKYRGLDISSYLHDAYEDAKEEGQDLYLVFSPDQWHTRTITEMTSTDFFVSWRFVDGEMENHFNDVELVNPKNA